MNDLEPNLDKSPARQRETSGGLLKSLGIGVGDTVSSFWGSRRGSGSENVFITDASANVVKAHKTAQIIRKVTEESVMGEDDD